MASGPAEGNPAPAVVATAEAPAPASSLPPPTQDLAARASKARSAADIRAIIKEGKQQVPLPPPEKPAEPAPAAPEPVAEVAPAGEETPAAEPEAPAEEAPAEEPTAPTEPEGDETEEENDGGDGPVTPITSKRAHLRLAQDDKVGRQAAALMKRNRDMGMEEAVAKARQMLGIKAPAEAAPTPETPTPASDLPQTIEAVDTELDRLDADREKALVELRFEDVAKIDRTTRKLDRHRLQLKEDGQRQQAEQAASYDRQFQASEARATELYAFASDPNSPGGKRMLEIEADLKANGDPLYNSPDKPLRVAQMVAAEMAIAPRKKGAPAAPAKPAAPVAAAPKKGIIPTGGSRTTPPTQTPESVVTSKVAEVKNPHQLRAFMKTLGVKA